MELEVTEDELSLLANLNGRKTPLSDDSVRYWSTRVNLKRFFKRMVEIGILTEACLEEKLAGSHRVSDLKTLLQAKKQPTDGKKQDLVARVMSTLPSRKLKRLTRDVHFYRTTELGKRVLIEVEAHQIETYKQEREKLQRQSLANNYELGITHVKIHVAPNSCDSCQDLCDRILSIEQASIPANPNCTHEIGCRCSYFAVLNEFCPQCGYEVEAFDKFCSQCGSAVSLG